MNAAVQNSEFTVVKLPRFGEFAYAPCDVFEFPWGVPGFPSLRRWIAVSLSSQPSFVWLQSLDDLNVALPTCDPWSIFTDYDPRLPAYAVAALEIANPADFTVLCVVVAGENAEEMSMNLMAPIVINLRTGRGRQVMLENSRYPVKQAIPRKSPQ